MNGISLTPRGVVVVSIASKYNVNGMGINPLTAGAAYIRVFIFY